MKTTKLKIVKEKIYYNRSTEIIKLYITSKHQACDGIALIIAIGFLDSSFMVAVYMQTAKVLPIKNNKENQKYVP